MTVPARGVVGARGPTQAAVDRPSGDADGRLPPCARPKQAHPRANGGGHLRRGRRARTWGPQMGSAACGRRRAAVRRRRQISTLGRGGPDPHPRKTRQIGCNPPLRRRMRSRRRREAAESGAYLAAGLHTRPKWGPNCRLWPQTPSVRRTRGPGRRRHRAHRLGHHRHARERIGRRPFGDFGRARPELSAGDAPEIAKRPTGGCARTPTTTEIAWRAPPGAGPGRVPRVASSFGLKKLQNLLWRPIVSQELIYASSPLREHYRARPP